MKNKKNSNDSLDKRDDDEMEDINENESEKTFNPEVLDDALEEGVVDEDESLDELEAKEIEEDSEDEIFLNNDEENPLWKL